MSNNKEVLHYFEIEADKNYPKDKLLEYLQQSKINFYRKK
jgi:hypothetical protein